jgi:hypothetical protein
MGNFIRNISSWIGAQPETRQDADGNTGVNGVAKGGPVAPRPPASHDEHGDAAAPSSALPLVPYTAGDAETLPLPRLRRARGVSLLRNGGTMALTTRAVPVTPVLATRHAPTHPTRPVLTETERVRLQVMQAQIQLSALRLYEGPIDGVMSPATATALRYFQTLKGLRPSGTLAAGTLAALGVELIH